MAAGRYRYSKKTGALQEAIGAGAPNIPSPDLLAQNQMPIQAQTRMRSPSAQNPPTQLVRSPKPVVNQPSNPPRLIKQSSLFWYIVEEGQQVLAADKSGKMHVIVGPKRVWRGGRQFRPMQHFVAHPGEFLIVRYRDGRQKHLPGPDHCWLDPREHLSIEKEEALPITTGEAVVVYTEVDGQVARRVAAGPASFVPSPGEWLHTFSWHGSVGGKKVPNALVFQKLSLLPDQMYHDVVAVRTADDASLTIHLMIFFRLLDIEKLLATSHDPIGDFVNAASSDVVEFVRLYRFDDFKTNSHQLNELATYNRLVSRASQCGYQIDNVVYCGYGAPKALELMHEKATESRTRLQLEKATEQQAQEMEDLQLERSMERQRKQRAAEKEAFEHKTEIQRLQQLQDLELRSAQAESERQQRLLDADQARKLALSEDKRKETHLLALKELGVDLTALLTSDRADRVIELRGGTGHIHLDDS